MNVRLLLLIALLPGFASAQFLPANTPLQQAFIQAAQENKLIFLLIESAGCQQCNDVADKGLQSKPVRAFYRMTNDVTYLRKALQWAAHANDFYESPYGLDTYARLLYKVDRNIDQAIQLEEKAIGLMIKHGYATAAFDTVLSKMKKGELNID